MNGKKAKLIRRMALAEAKPYAGRTPQDAMKTPKGQRRYAAGSARYIAKRIKTTSQRRPEIFNRVKEAFRGRDEN